MIYFLAFGARIPSTKIAAIGMGFVGVVIVAIAGGEIGGGRLTGVLFLVAAAACVALEAFAQRRWCSPRQFLRLDAWQLVGALIVLGAAAPLLPPTAPAAFASPGP